MQLRIAVSLPFGAPIGALLQIVDVRDPGIVLFLQFSGNTLGTRDVVELTPHAVQDKYYYARRPEVTRVVDVSGVVDPIIDANRANRAKGPAGHHGSRLRAELAKRGQKLPLLGDDDVTADRNYIREFILARRRTLGQKYGVQYAEAFHYIGGPRPAAVEEYAKKNAVPLK